MSDSRIPSTSPRRGNILLWTAIGLVAFAALMRLAPHPPNFAPVAAMALFGGAVLRRSLFAFAVPLAAMALSDIVLAVMGFSPVMAPWVYGSFVLIGMLGLSLRGQRSVARIFGASLAGSVLFFLITNFGVWATGLGYPMTPQGLVACYTAAIPFFANTSVGDLFWNAVLFGTYALIGRRLQAPAATLDSPIS